MCTQGAYGCQRRMNHGASLRRKAYILGEEADWETDPAIVELTVTSDGILLAGDTSDPLANAILGRADELAANLSRLTDAADLTEAERGRLGALTAAAITDWRQEI